MKANNMIKTVLTSCYWDGLSRNEAISFYSRCYGERPTDEQVSEIVKLIRECTGKEWR